MSDIVTLQTKIYKKSPQEGVQNIVMFFGSARAKSREDFDKCKASADAELAAAREAEEAAQGEFAREK
jgi:hypothetical protein